MIPKTETAPPMMAHNETMKSEKACELSRMCAWMGDTSYEISSEGSVSRVRACDVTVNWYVSMGRSDVVLAKEVGMMLMWCSCVSCAIVETKCFPSKPCS